MRVGSDINLCVGIADFTATSWVIVRVLLWPGAVVIILPTDYVVLASFCFVFS